MSMYNPHFDKCISMCENIAKFHVGELVSMRLSWLELKDIDGDVYQIVPLLDVKFKH